MFEQSHRFIRALKQEPVDKTPIWIMRQAGRYMPEYKALRLQAPNFLEFCKTPKLCLQAVMLPLEHFDLDAAILFSDILVIPNAMGMELEFRKNEGPVFLDPVNLSNFTKYAKLLDVNSSLDYALEAVALITQKLKNSQPLIGFAGSPWTLACYMLDGQGTKFFNKTRAFMYQHAAKMHELLTILAENVANFLIAQIKAGCDCVQIFDSWAALLGPERYLEYSANYIEHTISLIKAKYPKIPIVVFAKNGDLAAKVYANTNCEALALSWNADLAYAQQQAPNKVLQGNLDPACLYADYDVLEMEIIKVLRQGSKACGFVFNLGHGVYPDIQPEKVKFMCDIVHAYSE